MSDIQALLDQTAALHYHLCPRQVLGVRMGMHAASLLNLDLPQTDKRLFVFVETDGCFSDGVAVATGCWLGHRTMRLMDNGKVAATFVDTRTERAFRIWPNAEARRRAVDDRPDAPSHWHAQLDAYQTMPVDELLCWIEVYLNISVKAIISQPGVRVTCEGCGEEILNEREKVVDGHILCANCTGDSYWTISNPALFAGPLAAFPVTERAK